MLRSALLTPSPLAVHAAARNCTPDVSSLRFQRSIRTDLDSGNSGSGAQPSRSSCSSRRLIQARARSAAAAGSADGDDSDNIPPEVKVIYEKKDFSLRELLKMVDEGELDLQPQYQRGLVWDRKMASRLVVTALEKRMVPTVYLEEGEGGRYMIMDGKQRLTSLLTFIAGKQNIGNIHWDNAPVQLDIKEDSCDMRWQGKRFVDLPKDRQIKLEKYSIMCVIVTEDTDRDVVFNIYQDINTGAVGHTDQQNRKAAYHGTYITLLDELAYDENFLKIQGREAPDSEKETDRELALRFFAMLRSADRFKTPLFRFLNQELKQHQNADQQEIERLRKLFKQTTAAVWQIFGPLAGRQPKSSSAAAAAAAKARSKSGSAADLSEKFNPSLFDATMVAVCQELESSKQRRKEMSDAAGAICDAYRELCSTSEFKAALDNRSKQKVLQRISMMRRMLQSAAPTVTRDSRRAFSTDLKLQLWHAAAAPPLCGLCQQTIHTIGDAEVDHVVPWSHGGSTDLANAQLVHRFCNRHKGNRTAAATSGAASSTSYSSIAPAVAADISRQQ